MSLADALAFPPAAPSRIPVIDPALLRDSQHVIMQQAEGSQGDSEPKEEVEDQDMGDLFGDDAYVFIVHVSSYVITEFLFE